jgi:peptide deformylase
MIKQIIQYPTMPSQAFDGVVRHYDEALHTLLQDLKDTIEENKLDGLAAYQIGSPYAVLVIKDKNDFLDIINPIIITKEGSVTPTEKTAYYPKLTAKTKRYEKIKLMYEDRNGKQHFLTAEDDLAILIQRKTDYLLGSDFRVRMKEEEKRLFDAKLDKSSNHITQENCPTTEPKTIKNILLGISIILILGGFGSVLGLFVSDSFVATLHHIENYLMLFVLLSIVVYVFVAYYEGKKYSNCTSCQIGNILGTAFIQFIRLGLLAMANYFVF